MQIHLNLFSILPTEAFGIVYSFLNKEEQKKFSHIDKTILNMSKKLIYSIRLFPHYSGSNKDAPINTLVNIIERYPNAQKLILGPKSSTPSTGCEGFGKSEEKILKFMIEYFKKQPDQPFRIIELHEMKTSLELHKSLIESLSLSKVNSIVFRTFNHPSTLNSSTIQPILNSTLSIKKFKWIHQEYSGVRSSFSDTLAISLSFESQIHLQCAKFRHLHIHHNILQSLLKCSDLETLILDQCYFKDSTIKDLFINPHSWTKLKHLDISTIPLLSDHELDTITKQLPHLRTIHITLRNITEQGFKNLKKNCPHLTALKLHNENAKDLELEYLAENFHNMEILSFSGSDITVKGIKALTTCINLRVLRIGNLKTLEAICIQGLSQLKQLEALEINHVDILNLSEIPSLIENLPHLTYLQIRNGDNIKTQNYLASLRKKYPKLQTYHPDRKIRQFLS